MNLLKLFELVESLPNEAAIPAYRSIANSTLARGIGAIRSKLRQEARLERDAESDIASIDQRMTLDDLAAGTPEEVRLTMGFAEPVDFTKQARLYHAIHDEAITRLHTLTDSKWDEPMGFDLMADFMVNKAQTLDPRLVEVLATAAQTTPEAIKQMHELQSMREREQLKLQLPAIKTEWDGFSGEGYASAVEELDVVSQLALGVKLVVALGKAKDNVLNRVMRTRRISELSQIPLIDASIKEVRTWVEAFEKEHAEALGDALEAGRSVPTLDEV